LKASGVDRAVIARALLEVGAVSVRTDPLYEFSSGLRSPIYTDNRRLASHPAQRAAVTNALMQLVASWSPRADGIVGVATGGVPWAAWLADRMTLPLLYVRASAKDRGLEKQVEGDVSTCTDVIVVEDLITTGTSSARAVAAIRGAGPHVAGVVSIFSYDLPFAQRLFADLDIRVASLIGIDDVVSAAADRLSRAEVDAIEQWQLGLADYTPTADAR